MDSVYKRRVLRHNGARYVVSPYALIWDGDYYYMVGFNESFRKNKIQCFRLDRIKDQPEILDEEAVQPPKGFTVSKYCKSLMRMYGSGDPVDVRLQGDVSTMKGLIDHFGLKVKTEAVDLDTYLATVSVCPSPTFFRWVFGWNGAMKILGPEKVKEDYQKMVRKALEE